MSEGQRDLKDLRKSFYKSLRSFLGISPILGGVILLIGLFKTYITTKMTSSVFTGAILRDALLGSVFGSISAGNPITSYIIGGELIKSGVSLIAVTAFIVAWVTVGIVQLPAEMATLGRRFAIMVAIATVATLGMLL